MIKLKMKKNEMDNKIFVGYGKDEDFKCSQCKVELKEGYICENNKDIVLCKECQELYPMHRCTHSKDGLHNHIKFIRGKEDA